jgi:hypothetical protein
LNLGLLVGHTIRHMDDVAAGARRRNAARAASGLLIGAAGGALLSIVTSQGFLHAAVVTGAGYTGRAQELDPAGQLVMVVAWLAIGAVAGFVGRSALAFVGLWLGALVGSGVGFMNDPAGNVLWLDVIVTIVGITLFVTPGFFLGSAFAGSRERLAPDGSGHRPTPPPLWSRDVPVRQGPHEGEVGSTVPAAAGHRPPASHPSSAYARPGSQQPE